MRAGLIGRICRQDYASTSNRVPTLRSTVRCGCRLKTDPGSTLACSELKLQRQLDRARPANLVERVKPAIRATGPQAVRQRLRRAAEQGAGQAVGGGAEVRVVQDVEELGSETKPHLFGDAKLPLQPD